MTRYNEPADRTIVALAHPATRELERVFRRDDTVADETGYAEADGIPTGRHWYEVAEFPEPPSTWEELEDLAGSGPILVLHVGAEVGAEVGGTWRVQFISRLDVGEPDRDEGVRDFDNQAYALVWFDSAEVQSRLGVYWRAEVRYLPAARVVVSVPFREPAAVE